MLVMSVIDAVVVWVGCVVGWNNGVSSFVFLFRQSTSLNFQH